MMRGMWDPEDPANRHVDLTNASPQPSSAFLTKLPPEIRRVIYSYLWLSNGLEQHILVDAVWSNDPKLHGTHQPPDASTTPSSKCGDTDDRHESTPESKQHIPDDHESKDVFAPVGDKFSEAGSAHMSQNSNAEASFHEDCLPATTYSHAADLDKTRYSGGEEAAEATSPGSHARNSSMVSCRSSEPRSPKPTQVGHVRRKRCVTDYSHPDLSLADGLSALPHEIAEHRRRHDPSFTDGTAEIWRNLCYWCKDPYDCWLDLGNMPNPPQQSSDFMSMLLVCKSMYREVLSSIMDDVRWSFSQFWDLPTFLSLRFPMVAMMRRIIILWTIEGSSQWQTAEWEDSLSRIADLEHLKEIEIWLDYGRRWSNNKARSELHNPRRARIWAKVPERVRIKVTYPTEFMAGFPSVTCGHRQLDRFVDINGGWVRNDIVEQ